MGKASYRMEFFGNEDEPREIVNHVVEEHKKETVASTIIVTVLGCMIFTGLASANLLEVKKAVEGAHCQKLATDYAKDPSSFPVQSIAQLQICLAQTLKATTSRAIPRDFDIQSPRPSTSNVDTTLPTLPTPPTPPQSINIK